MNLEELLKELKKRADRDSDRYYAGAYSNGLLDAYNEAAHMLEDVLRNHHYYDCCQCFLALSHGMAPSETNKE
jgi:hypothetical protein